MQGQFSCTANTKLNLEEIQTRTQRRGFKYPIQALRPNRGPTSLDRDHQGLHAKTTGKRSKAILRLEGSVADKGISLP